MSKTITLRIDDEIYEVFKFAAKGEKRTISNFIETAALNYLSQDSYVDQSEMKEILEDKTLVRNILNGLKDAENGNYEIIG
jgi:uncharacterized protein (DUF1778 family)